MDRITKLGLVASLTVLLFCRGSLAQDSSSCFGLLNHCEVVIGSLQEIPENICSPQSNITMCLVGIRDTCDPIFISTLFSEAAKFKDYRCSETGQQDFGKFINCTSTSKCRAMREPPAAPNYCNMSKSYVNCIATNCESGAESYARAEEELGYVLSYRLCGITGISCYDKLSLCEKQTVSGGMASCSVGRSCLQDAYQTCQDGFLGTSFTDRIQVLMYRCSEQGMTDEVSFMNCGSFGSCRSEAEAKGLDRCREQAEIIACLQRECGEGAARYYNQTSSAPGQCTGPRPVQTTIPGVVSTGAAMLPPPVPLNRCQVQTPMLCDTGISNWQRQGDLSTFCSDDGIAKCRQAIRDYCQAGTVPSVLSEAAVFYDYRCSESGKSDVLQYSACSSVPKCRENITAPARDCQLNQLYLDCVAKSCNVNAAKYARAEAEIIGSLTQTTCGSDGMRCIDKYFNCQEIFFNTLSMSTYEARRNELCRPQSAYKSCLDDAMKTCNNNAVVRRIISEPIRVLKYECSQQGKEDRASYLMCASPCRLGRTNLHPCQSLEQERACVESACGEAAARYLNESRVEPSGICVAKDSGKLSGTAGLGIGDPTFLMILIILGLLFK